MLRILIAIAVFVGGGVHARLVFQDYFQNLTNWVLHPDGHTSKIQAISKPNQQPPTYLYTNITQCSPGYCFRSEVAIKPTLRSKLIPNISSEYWVGVSLSIPSTWSYPPSASSTVKDVTYHFQLHGGDNEGFAPNLGIRQSQQSMTANVCGNTSPQGNPICSYFDLGQIVSGEWMDFVIHGKFSAVQPNGFVKIWRNGQLKVDQSNILTAYDETLPPYLIVGSYQYNWKNNATDVPYRWVSAYHRSVKVGDASSSYTEVYPGNSSFANVIQLSFAPTASPTKSPSIFIQQSSSSSSSSPSFNLLYLALIIPVVTVIVCMLFYCGWEETRGKRCFKHLSWTQQSASTSTVEQQQPQRQQQQLNLAGISVRSPYSPVKNEMQHSEYDLEMVQSKTAISQL